MSATSVEALRLLARVHGHLGWLAAAALIHPAIALRNPRRRARLAVTLATATTAATFGIGAFIYDDFSRQGLRRAIYVASRGHGLLFERKEHLAVGVLALAVAGCVAHLFAHDPARPWRARFAHRAFVAAAVLAVVVATMGTLVSAFKSW
jgi:hypothetical protein